MQPLSSTPDELPYADAYFMRQTGDEQRLLLFQCALHYSRGFLNKPQILRGFGLLLLSDISPSGEVNCAAVTWEVVLYLLSLATSARSSALPHLSILTSGSFRDYL